MAKKEKTLRPKARVPRGFRDRFGAEIADERDMLERISAVYESFGFDPLETPAFEYTDALGKFLPDIDRPNQGVFSLQDDDEQWMSLRYDLTAPLARYVAENYDALPKPFRRYAVGTVWRNEKPGPGRFRQFTQCDADTVGAPAPHADAEMCMLFAKVIEVAGVNHGDFVIRVSNRKIIDGLFEKIGLAGEETRATRLGVMRSMDKFDRLGEAGVRQLLGSGRKDESGDFTKGVGLTDSKIESVVAFLTSTVLKDKAKGPTLTGANEETLNKIAAVLNETPSGMSGVSELMAINRQILDDHKDAVVIDLSIIRGLEYYTGPVFEADLTFGIKDEKGQPVRLGSVGGGGRYDSLVERFKGIEVPAVGISVGVSRLCAALPVYEKFQKKPNLPSPVVILALEDGQMADYHSMAAELRAAGVRAEVYLGGSGMKAQMKYADKRNSPVTIICGEDERAKGEVTIKDLVLGAELSKKIEDNAEWREGQKAQTSVKRADLVEEVKRALARQR